MYNIKKIALTNRPLNGNHGYAMLCSSKQGGKRDIMNNKLVSARNIKWKKIWKKMKAHWMLYLFLLPATVFFIVFHYYPLYGVQIAFQNYRIGDTFGQSEWVGLKHFIRFFESYWFTTVVWNTLKLSLLNLIFGFPMPIILALLLNEVSHQRYKKFVQSITYAPHFISLVVLCGSLQLFLSPTTGIISIAFNAVRGWMGLGPINLLASGAAFPWIYVLSGIWQGTGWGSIIYMAALSGVDTQVQEAAMIDGASRLQRIWYVNIPVLIPTIVTMLILQCGSLLSSSFDKVLLLQNDGIRSASETINTYVYRSGLVGAQYSFSSAVGLFNGVVNALFMILANQITRLISKENAMF